ncbi:PAS domain-containing sensor histidine kinase [Leisingera thetidis]|uniref:PAS domain-containing sensor histidine kinase n=1 Tax=Leisingera thetidis TaxID=2930199 RepID=UPI0021F77A85|nr:PAS domain-containing hybrid sensor histidine kinase/response regulator [Leisingera thetidis]
MHYLKRELYDLVKKEDVIFDFLQIGSLDGLWYWDLENPEHEWMSPEFWRLFGVDPDSKQHFASEWQDLIHPDDLAVALENFQKHLADPDHPYDQIVRYRHTAGHMVTVRCRGMAIRDEAGKPLRMLGAHNDLTELKASEASKAKFAKLNARLEAEVVRANSAVEARTAFLATMSHEIRTPLNVILGLFHLIKTDETASAKTRERADVGHRAAEQLLAQLVNVVEAARLDSDALELRRQPVLVETMVLQWREALQASATRYGKALETGVAVADGVPECLILDGAKVTQIINNLVDNAVKFTDEGRVFVWLAHDASAQHPICITVLDTGPGIPAADRTRVFERFTQLESTRLQHKGGSGLGLSICHELATLMGGKLTILELPPEGFSLCVRLSLPDGEADRAG